MLSRVTWSDLDCRSFSDLGGRGERPVWVSVMVIKSKDRSLNKHVRCKGLN